MIHPLEVADVVCSLQQAAGNAHISPLEYRGRSGMPIPVSLGVTFFTCSRAEGSLLKHPTTQPALWPPSHSCPLAFSALPSKAIDQFPMHSYLFPHLVRTLYYFIPRNLLEFHIRKPQGETFLKQLRLKKNRTHSVHSASPYGLILTA